MLFDRQARFIEIDELLSEVRGAHPLDRVLRGVQIPFHQLQIDQKHHQRRTIGGLFEPRQHVLDRFVDLAFALS